MKYNCLIVDDEPIAQDILENYILKVDSLQLISKCDNAIEALQVLQTQKIDILFLDINMPSLSGIEMLKILDNPPNTILTTAYSEYAIKAYELNVKDYLMKPFSFERFLKAIHKITSTNQNTNIPENILENNSSDFIFFKSDKTIYKYYYKDITHFEGYGNYTKVHSLHKKTILISEKLNILENKLSPSGFVRVHKSFIVNLSHINEIIGNKISVNLSQIPIGVSYKTNFWDKIKEH